MPWVEVREGNGAGPLGESFDAMLINAGVTHPQAGWLDALAPGGRLILPLTATMPVMGPIGKGLLVLIEPPAARVVTFVAIYSALGLRDDDLNRALGQAMQRNPFPPIKALRRDAHEASPSCWLHFPGVCFSLEALESRASSAPAARPRSA